ncbi:unnamed protein product, partial [Amoebophrya sp. A25]|eukprot:GSA25T00024039001.1
MLSILSAKLQQEAEKSQQVAIAKEKRFNAALVGIRAPGPRVPISKARALPWQKFAGIQGSSSASSSSAAKSLPYFKPPSHCATGVSSAKAKSLGGIPREVMTGKRKVACDIAGNIHKLGNALSSLDNMLLNSKSNAVANSRLRTYEIIMSKSSIKPWPATEVSLYTFIGVAVAAEYASTPEIVSDVLAASP